MWSIIVTDTIEYTDDNLFKILYKSVEDELLETTNELTTLLKNETIIKAYDSNLRIIAIQTLKKLLWINNRIEQQLPRVTSNIPDPPDLVDESNKDEPPPKPNQIYHIELIETPHRYQLQPRRQVLNHIITKTQNIIKFWMEP